MRVCAHQQSTLQAEASGSHVDGTFNIYSPASTPIWRRLHAPELIGSKKIMALELTSVWTVRRFELLGHAKYVLS